MANGEARRLTKEQKREQRRHEARRRRRTTQLKRAGPLLALLAIAGLWSWERAGSSELVEAEVIETRRWKHIPQDGPPHPHISATLLIEGLSETTLERADGYERGQRVPVWIRRGRISGWPYFLDLANPGGAESP